MLVIIYESDDYSKSLKYRNVVDVHVTVCENNVWFDGEKEVKYQTMNVDLVDDTGSKNTLSDVYDIEIL